jgi:endonuclease YncB( thermonuclease family)
MFCGCNEIFHRLFGGIIISRRKGKKDKVYKKWFRNSSRIMNNKDTKENNNNYQDFYSLDTLKSLNTDLSYLDCIRYVDTCIFIPPVKYGKVIKVYDGDTITIASKLDFENSPIYRFSVRLAGIDSPEMKANSNIEKVLANKSQTALFNMLMNQKVRLENVTIEKYGRLLADVYYDDIHVNKWMIDNNFAVPYDGGKKERPAEWEDSQTN